MIGTRYVRAIGCAALIAGALLTAPQHSFAEGDAPAGQPAAQQPAAPPTPVFSADPQIAGAQHAVLTFAKATNLPALKGALSDRSAGLIGVITVIPMAYIVENAPDQLPDPKAVPALKRDFEAYMRGYGIDAGKALEISSVPSKVQGHGHEFLQGLVPFANRFNGKKPDDNAADPSTQLRPPLPEDLNVFTFTSVSPTHVKITPQDPKALHIPGVETFEAVQEDGAWRVDLGDSDKILGDLKKAMKQASQ